MIIIFIGFALLSSAMVANKVALLYMQPALFVGIRMAAAGLILTMHQWHKTNRFTWYHLRPDIIVLLCISLLTTLIPSLFKAYALQHMISAKFSFFGSIDPFITAIYAYAWWHERLSLTKIAGMLVGFFGLMILLFSTSLASPSSLFSAFSYPEVAALAAPMLGRIGWMLVQSLLRKERYTAPEINGITMLVSGIFSLGLAYATNQYTIVCDNHEFMLIGAMIYTIIIGNVIALTMYAHFLKHHTATFISLAGFSINFFVAFYGWLLLGEIPPLHFFVACAITFLGLLLFYADEIRKRTS